MASNNTYTVGVVCALPLEATAVIAMLDERYERCAVDEGDQNQYTFGRMGEHRVVIACLPGGSIGKVSAAVAAKDMLRSFKIRYGLMVGIGGGVWSIKRDVRLGDVVVSQPDGQNGGVVQWDMGKTEAGGFFRRTGALNKPPPVLLSGIQTLKMSPGEEGVRLDRSINEMLSRRPSLREYGYTHPGRDSDQLFEADYQHDSSADDCKDCDQSRRVGREQRTDDAPRVHYGVIASGDQVIKDGRTRDRIAEPESILCFEMEAAGLMDNFPCLVIRGVCDYADSHKNKRWQAYAAAVAAAYAKDLLLCLPAEKVADARSAREASFASPIWNNYEGSKVNSQVQHIGTLTQTFSF